MKTVRIILLFSVFVFLSLLFYTPVFSVLRRAFLTTEGSFTLLNLKKIIMSSYDRRVIFFTLYQAFLSTLFSLLLGLPGAYLLARKNFPGKSVLKAVATIPFVLPSILVVLGFVIFFGNNGYLNQLFMKLFKLHTPPLKILYSMKAIILAHSFYNFPVAMRIIASLWEKLSITQIQAAHSLGAGPVKSFLSITLPQLLPALLSAASLIFLFCFSSFAIILVLGGGPRYSTIEVEIYRLATVSFNQGGASSFAVLGMSFTLFLLYITFRFQTKLSKTEDFILSSQIKNGYVGTEKKLEAVVVIYMIFIFILVAGPLLSVIIKSFYYPVSRAGGDYLSFKSYINLFTSRAGGSGPIALVAIKNSLIIASITVLLSVPLGTILSYFSVKKWIPSNFVTGLFDTLFMLPLVVSSVILGLGYMFLRFKIPSTVLNSTTLIIFAHTIITYPFVLRSITGVLSKIKPDLSYAAKSLGATPFGVFTTIEVPLIKGAIITGTAFAFALSIGELNATILLAQGQIVTIPLAMYRLIGAYNFYGACALGTILVIMTFLSFMLMEKANFVKRSRL